MPWHQIGVCIDKSRSLKELVVCNNWDLEPLDLLSDLALFVINRPLRYESYVINIYKIERKSKNES